MVLPAAAVFSFAAGVFWTVSLLGARRRSVMLVVIAASIISAALFTGIHDAATGSPNARQLSRQLSQWWIVAIVGGWMLLVTLVGVWLGRSLARWFVCLALPARGRVPFSILWTRDGLEPPKPHAL